MLISILNKILRSKILINLIIYFLIIAIIYFLDIFLGIDCFYLFYIKENNNVSFFINSSYIAVFVLLFFNVVFNTKDYKDFCKIFLIFSLIICFITILMFCNNYKINKNLFVYSDFYEKYYKDPQKIKIIAPENKRNLILIYLESIDYGVLKTVFKDEEIELIKIAKENLAFSNYQAGHNQDWTQAALLATTTGIPYTLMNNIRRYLPKFETLEQIPIGLNTFAKNAYSIFEILKNNGYSVFFLEGASIIFSGTDIFLKDHGLKENEICGLEQIEEKYEYKQIKDWWGIEDKYSYKIFKENILKLSQKQPFFAVMITLDTHFGEYKGNRKASKEVTKNNIVNLRQASILVNDFVNWLKKQSFSKDTTLVIVGDHPRMGNEFDIDDKDERKIYNVFINSVIKPVNTDRTFNQIDLFPSLLECIGFNVEGNSLGLGTSIFSDKKTLVELLGKEELEKSISQRNKLYNKLWK